MSALTVQSLHIPQLDGLSKVGQEPKGDQGRSFAKTLEAVLDETNATQKAADSTVQDFIEGKDVSVHQMMIGLTHAELSMRLLTTVTNKAISAYQEIARLHV